MYLLDANVLIEAKNRYYAFDIAPGFWTWLEQAHGNQLVCSIEAVEQEILEGDDALSMWAHAHPQFFRPMDSGTTSHFPQLTAWASSREYTAAAITEFVGNTADFYLVAFAREHGHTVVTHEGPQPLAKKRVLIPDACVAMTVPFADTFTMLRNSGARLELSQ